MHWKIWESLCKPKACGGLGFKDLEAYNITLLGKQLWRMMSNPDSLMAKVFKSKYFKNSDPLNASLGYRPSFAWRSIFTEKKLIQRGARVIIGNGRHTKVWQERWIGKEPASMVQSMVWDGNQTRCLVPGQMTVSELMDQSGRAWNENLLECLFTKEEKGKIRQITPAGMRSEDTYSWE